MVDSYALLVIARSQTLANRLQGALDSEQYRIRWVPNGSQALGLDIQPHLLVVELPASGGGRMVARLKKRFPIPLIALLRSGQACSPVADGCMVRPYRIARLGQLVEELLITHAPGILQAAGLSLDTRTRRLHFNGAVIQLPPIACQILTVLMEKSGDLVHRDELFRQVWQTEQKDNTRALDVHVAQLRRLLEPDPRHPKLIVTERGLGYRLQPTSPDP